MYSFFDNCATEFMVWTTRKLDYIKHFLSSFVTYFKGPTFDKLASSSLIALQATKVQIPDATEKNVKHSSVSVLSMV